MSDSNSPHSTTRSTVWRRWSPRSTPDSCTASAYPSEWTIADTLSHVGSGAVIFLRLVDDALAGVETPGRRVPGGVGRVERQAPGRSVRPTHSWPIGRSWTDSKSTG